MPTSPELSFLPTTEMPTVSTTEMPTVRTTEVPNTEVPTTDSLGGGRRNIRRSQGIEMIVEEVTSSRIVDDVSLIGIDVEEESPSNLSEHSLASMQVQEDDVTPPSPQTWIELVTDDFEDDYGIFHPGSDEYVTYYPFVKDRKGVFRIQHGSEIEMGSSLYSDNIALDNASTTSRNTIKVVFSYYANSMEIQDGFCLDYSLDDGSIWHTQRCWNSVYDFDNGIWYDDTSVSFELSQSQQDVHDLDSFRIRIRCNSNSVNDDLLIDKVQVMELLEIEFKDSI